MPKAGFQCLLCILMVACLTDGTDGCSIFLLSGTEQAIVGRNYDWETSNGILLVNKRGMSKTALGLENPMQWDSKFGSVTFNQYGREFPCGGMNEKGLVIEVLWLDGSKYPTPDERPMVSTLQWVQYQLDTAATVEDVIASDERLRIQTISGTRVHYFVAERSGKAATIEFIDGKMVAHYGDSLPVAALTNSTYKRSMKQFRKSTQNSAEASPAEPTCDGSSLGRFTCAGQMATQFDENTSANPIEYSFEVLNRVKQGSYTKWSIVYDTADSRIFFKTRDANQVRHIDFGDLDFSNVTPILTLDLDEELEGNIISEMQDYSHELNASVMRQSIKETPVFSELPRFLMDNVAEYPRSIEPAGAEPITADTAER